ncbi:hypothetical protein NGRA_0217, partial [Nosema granulosis]
MNREEENSTFHEAKEHFKEVKERLKRKETDEKIIVYEDKTLDPSSNIINTSIVVTENNSYEILERCLTHILETIYAITNNAVYANIQKEYSGLCTMDRIEQKTELILKTISDSLKVLKASNDVVYNVIYKMDTVCKEIVLSNSDLLAIVQQILLKFCEVGDLLDYKQSETTINALFDMSKLIYIYKSKIKELTCDEIQTVREIVEVDDSLESLCDGSLDIPYTDWTTWIGTFIEEKKESFEGTPIKKKCVRKIKEEKVERMSVDNIFSFKEIEERVLLKPIDNFINKSIDKPIDKPIDK